MNNFRWSSPNIFFEDDCDFPRKEKGDQNVIYAFVAIVSSPGGGGNNLVGLVVVPKKPGLLSAAVVLLSGAQ